MQRNSAMERPVSSIMTTPVRSVHMDDTVEAVGKELHRHHMSFVPVVDNPNGAAIGVISTSDLLQFKLTKRDPKSVRAWEICSYKPIEADPDESIADVAKKMVERGVHHVIVMRGGSMKGVVSSLDFVKQYISDD